MKEEYNARIDAITRAICRETCAYKGEPPCWKLVENGERVMFPPPTCDEPGCFALAEAAVDAVGKLTHNLPTPSPHPEKTGAENL